MSGLLKGCRHAPSNVIASRDEGRTLFLGITPNGDVLGYAATPDDPLSKELYALTSNNINVSSVLIELFPPDKKQNTRVLLLLNSRDIPPKPSMMLGSSLTELLF
ncbi:MAG: hypothetical protein QJT81_20530 [Candidatus Thiothrix putei]|uniref:Uncharacterized protein n=1 Tax=Candidatus Thiothrix putei TaxID=3080811 RepID=A0AA95HDY9_9GAMM|nr:MAG: hypothetical protein QJT81_20530 [Candidatus Thiothrix putei]